MVDVNTGNLIDTTVGTTARANAGADMGFIALTLFVKWNRDNLVSR